MVMERVPVLAEKAGIVTAERRRAQMDWGQVAPLETRAVEPEAAAEAGVRDSGTAVTPGMGLRVQGGPGLRVESGPEVEAEAGVQQAAPPETVEMVGSPSTGRDHLFDAVILYQVYLSVILMRVYQWLIMRSRIARSAGLWFRIYSSAQNVQFVRNAAGALKNETNKNHGTL
jgi:hypothetical protein